MFEQQLQFIAERLADRLGRSVIIDDAALRPLAVSAQTGLVDASRIEAVLRRRTSDRHRRMLAELGIFRAREPVSIPAGDAVSLPRLCLPLVNGEQLLGFLWLIDEPALTAAQTERARTPRRRPRGCCSSVPRARPRGSTPSARRPMRCCAPMNATAGRRRAR